MGVIFRILDFSIFLAPYSKIVHRDNNLNTSRARVQSYLSPAVTQKSSLFKAFDSNGLRHRQTCATHVDTNSINVPLSNGNWTSTYSTQQFSGHNKTHKHPHYLTVRFLQIKPFAVRRCSFSGSGAYAIGTFTRLPPSNKFALQITTLSSKPHRLQLLLLVFHQMTFK